MRLSLVLMSFALLAGCAEQPKPAPGASTETPAASTASTEAASVGTAPADTTTATEPATAAPATATVELSIKSFDDLQALIASHKGKVVVVDYWSTQCEPCIAEFPHLVALHRKYSAEKLVCISASLDYSGLPSRPLEKCREEALEFLQKQGATLTNVILQEDDITVLDEKLKVPSMPVVIVYGADGAVQKQFDESKEPVSYEKLIAPLVDRLVAELPAR
jgi:thiol-disulfide isomerase/thioredoxin